MGKNMIWILSLLIVILMMVNIECIKAETIPDDRDNIIEYMSREERESLKNEARDMFYHAYHAYMNNAYPADELMPLSCKGRYRGSEIDRGDIDSTLGNFSLTLVDTLDTLVVIGDLDEFENAVKLVIKDVTFDTDVIVSLFETNIRMLGGLLSGHILIKYLQLTINHIMPWYNDELLLLAKDLGFRFLPAFNTTTGIPYGRINLKYGMKGVPTDMCRETCTACAGSMILEMAALSRLTGQSIFEEKAQKAMDALWRIRHRGTDLMGSVLNVHSGDWVRQNSGVGAGIDSYYEYCLKAYILLGDEKYLGRFNKHYQAVMKYVSQGPMLLDVHMHRPNTNSKNFMDALLAFWPGLQVLKGDIKPAVETHEMLYQVMQRHNFIPEAFTTDFQVHWGHHPLRPEFLESTYFLYRATGDHYYLGVGKKVLKSLQTYAKVFCGYAAVSDVRTNKHDDTMDSFVLSETFKYLYLLFAEPSDLILDLDKFIFTTEGHLLPLTLAGLRVNTSAELDIDAIHIDEMDRTCPNSLNLFPASVRQPLRNMVEDVCPRRFLKRRLSASQFQANNLDHLKILSNMGITVLTTTDGRMQLLHTFSNAKTVEDAEEGLMFMQEMIELNRKQLQESEVRRIALTFNKSDGKMDREMILLGGPAQFGKQLKGDMKVTGQVVYAEPSEACQELTNADIVRGKIAIVSRGNCMFVEKAKVIEKAGAIAGIVLDTTIGSSIKTSSMFAMSGDGITRDTIKIPMVFLFNLEANELALAIMRKPQGLVVTLSNHTGENVELNSSEDDLSIFEKLKSSLKEFLTRSTDLQSVETKNLAEITSDTDKNGDIVIEQGFLRAVIMKNVDNKNQGDPKMSINIWLTMNQKLYEIEKKKMEKKLEININENDFKSLLFERGWSGIKQQLLHQMDLSATLKSNFFLSLSSIERYYNYFREEHNRKNKEFISDNLPPHELVSWFLNELINTKFINSNDLLDISTEISNSLRNKLKPIITNENDNDDTNYKDNVDNNDFSLKKDRKSLKFINDMVVDTYKVYDKLLDNIQKNLKNLKNLKNEFHKHNNNSSNNDKKNNKKDDDDDDENNNNEKKQRTDEL